MAIDTRVESRFCSTCARAAGLDTAGSTYANYDQLLMIETPLPWPARMFLEQGVMPPEIVELVRLLIMERPAGTREGLRPLAIAPDPDYSRPGYRRVIQFMRPNGPFATFTREEYLVPEEQVGPLAWALGMAPERLPEFERYHEESRPMRDLLICTHGTVDVACGKFGYPAYCMLRERAAHMSEHTRIWRVSHFGGHVYAPTLIDMPGGQFWGYIEPEEADILLTRSGSITRLHDCYRGWAGLEDALLQVAERELLMRHGWSWLEYRKAGRVLAQDEAGEPDRYGRPIPAWSDLRIEYESPDGRDCGAYEIRLMLEGHVETIPSSKTVDTYAYPQYSVVHLTEMPMPELDIRQNHDYS